MKFYQSIRFRIVSGTLLFGGFLIILNTTVLFFIMGKSLSSMITNLVATEADYFLYKYENDKTTPLPHSKYIRVYQTLSDVPDRMKDRIKDLPPGIHAFRPENKRQPLHLAVIQLPDKEGFYYLIFHGRAFFEENALLNPREILMLCLALSVIPGCIIGYFLSRVLFKPVDKLMDRIRNIDPENLQIQFLRHQAENEIGMLSSTIETTMNRIKEFIQREKRFTQDASHELRTPITIVSGAVEIMEQQPEVKKNSMLSRPLKRIAGSVKDMQTTIETFLFLAREESDTQEYCQVTPVVRKAIQDNKHLIDDKEIDLHLEISDNITLKIKEEVLYIIVSNLIRNAFQFTHKGAITIFLDKARFSIQDTGQGIKNGEIDTVTKPHRKGDKSQGFGIGLNIVSRLCRRFGWELKIDSEIEVGTHVKIFWNNQ